MHVVVRKAEEGKMGRACLKDMYQEEHRVGERIQRGRESSQDDSEVTEFD